MTRTLGLASLMALVVSQAHAQTSDDVSTIDGIIKAYYEVVSGPAGESADRERDMFLHHSDAWVAIADLDPSGNPSLARMSLAEYHDRFGGARTAPFYEKEIHRTTQRFGNMAHVWSTYAISDSEGGETVGRGINSITLYHDGSRWWIMGWMYDSERAGNPIPRQYLPN